MSAIINNKIISGISAVTSIGGNAAQTCTIANADIIGTRLHPFYRCKPMYPNDEKALPLYCNRVPFIDDQQSGAERLLQLAVPALREVVVNAQLNDVVLPRTKLLLALPERDSITVNWRLEDAFVTALCQRVGIYPIASSFILLGGRTSVFELLARACEALDKGECDLCIVGGVDSYLFKHRLDALHLNGLLRSEKNIDGFIPGEAASFVVLETEENARQRGAGLFAKLGAMGFSHEPHTPETGRKSSGVGLTQAIRQATTTQALPIKTIYSDLNGESYSAFEWGIAQVRMADKLCGSFVLRHPAENYGDTGAATGALLLTLAAYNLKPKEDRQAAKHPALLFASALSGVRATAILNPIE